MTEPRTRLYMEGEDLQALPSNQALAGCGRCGRTLVVTLSPNWHQEYWYCSDREDCAKFKQARPGEIVNKNAIRHPQDTDH